MIDVGGRRLGRLFVPSRVLVNICSPHLRSEKEILMTQKINSDRQIANRVIPSVF